MNIAEIQQKTEKIFKTHDVKYAGIFGSVSRGEENETSDIDLLVKFKKFTHLCRLLRIR